MQQPIRLDPAKCSVTMATDLISQSINLLVCEGKQRVHISEPVWIWFQTDRPSKSMTMNAGNIKFNTENEELISVDIV
jgi:hypothetical protein